MRLMVAIIIVLSPAFFVLAQSLAQPKPVGPGGACRTATRRRAASASHRRARRRHSVVSERANGAEPRIFVRAGFLPAKTVTCL